MKQEIQGALEWLLALEDEGYEAVLVGGAVRDLYLGMPLTDVDIATSAPLEVVLRLWPGAKPVGKPPLQTACLQCGRIPVEFCSYCGFSLEHDLARRDFTVNAMAMTRLGKLVDPRGGKTDLTRRRLRFNYLVLAPRKIIDFESTGGRIFIAACAFRSVIGDTILNRKLC